MSQFKGKCERTVAGLVFFITCLGRRRRIAAHLRIFALTS